MATAPRPRGGLPDEILLWEVFTRLPTKRLLLCRAVCRAWRRLLTSAADFLLAHHRRQPSLPLVSGMLRPSRTYLGVLSIHAAAAAAAASELQPLAILDDGTYHLAASCDGLLVFSVPAQRSYFICNPTTRQWGKLAQLHGFSLLWLYAHRPTGEYRLLVYRRRMSENRIDMSTTCYVITLGGGGGEPRRIVIDEFIADRISMVACHVPPVLIRGSLHWYPIKHEVCGDMIMVFDTMAESFSLMRAPVFTGRGCLFEVEGALGLYSYDDSMGIVSVWVLQDYESKLWALKHQVELPVAVIMEQFGGYHNSPEIVVCDKGDLHVLLDNGKRLLHLDSEGKILGNFLHYDQVVHFTKFMFKQSIIPHTFFPTLEGYVVNGSPFV